MRGSKVTKPILAIVESAIQLQLHPRGEGVFLGFILGGGMPPGSPNPDPISDQKMSFSTPVFKPGLQTPYSFSDLPYKNL